MTHLIICAMKEELDPILSLLTEKKEVQKEGFTVMEGFWHDQPVACTVTRYGKTNATILTTTLILSYRPQSVWMIGVAGGMGSHVAPGDICISQFATHHDVGLVTDEGTNLWDPKNPITQEIIPHQIPASPSLLKKIKNITSDTLKRIDGTSCQYHIGPFATGDAFIASTLRKNEIIKNIQPIAVDMETAALAQTCTIFNIPWICIKSISDMADSTSHDAFEKNLPQATLNSASYVGEYFKWQKEHPEY